MPSSKLRCSKLLLIIILTCSTSLAAPTQSIPTPSQTMRDPAISSYPLITPPPVARRDESDDDDDDDDDSTFTGYATSAVNTTDLLTKIYLGVMYDWVRLPLWRLNAHYIPRALRIPTKTEEAPKEKRSKKHKKPFITGNPPAFLTQDWLSIAGSGDSTSTPKPSPLIRRDEDECAAPIEERATTPPLKSHHWLVTPSPAAVPETVKTVVRRNDSASQTTASTTSTTTTTMTMPAKNETWLWHLRVSLAGLLTQQPTSDQAKHDAVTITVPQTAPPTTVTVTASAAHAKRDAKKESVSKHPVNTMAPPTKNGHMDDKRPKFYGKFLTRHPDHPEHTHEPPLHSDEWARKRTVSSDPVNAMPPLIMNGHHDDERPRYYGKFLTRYPEHTPEPAPSATTGEHNAATSCQPAAPRRLAARENLIDEDPFWPFLWDDIWWHLWHWNDKEGKDEAGSENADGKFGGMPSETVEARAVQRDKEKEVVPASSGQDEADEIKGVTAVGEEMVGGVVGLAGEAGKVEVGGE